MATIDRRNTPITRRPVDNTTTPATTANTGAAATTPASPANTTTTPAGLDAATAGGTVPQGARPTDPSAPSGGTSALNLLAGQFVGSPDMFDLVPGRLNDAVALPTVLKQIGNTPEGQATVKGLIDQFQAKTGLSIPPAMVAAAMANPEKLIAIMQATPEQLSVGMDGLNAAHQAGQIPDVKPRKLFLPQKFDFSDIGNITVDLPKTSAKELAPGIMKGEVRNDKLDDAGAKTNIIMAEVFDRLSQNPTAKDGDKFSVGYNGGNFTRVDTFLAALKKDGYEVQCDVKHRVANFSSLLTQAPNGDYLDIPAPLMVRTGKRDAQSGEEAVVPAIHSDLVIRLKAGPNSSQKLDSEMKFYQGISATGFFPYGLYKEPTWTGGKITDTFKGKEADKAVELAGLLSDVINDAASSQGLIAAGYGVTGVCNDSVSVIQHAITGDATAYPLLMRDATLTGEIKKRLSDTNRRDDPEYRTLAASIDALPADMKQNATSHERAEESLPYAVGQEPFKSSERARAILLQ